MSNIAYKGNPLGSGTITLETPNTNTDRTLTLPDATGEVIMKDVSGITTLTRDWDNVNRGALAISGDKPSVVYASNTTHGHWMHHLSGDALRTYCDTGSNNWQLYHNIDNSGRVTTPSQPAFLATAPSSFSGNGSVAGSEVFQYTDVKTNIGSGYNTGTSTFTAPVAGNYQINWWASVSSSSDSARYFRLRLMKNGAIFLNPHNTVSDETNNADYNLCGGSAIVNLSANDTLYVEFGSSLATSEYAFYSDMCWFSGYLVG